MSFHDLDSPYSPRRHPQDERQDFSSSPWNAPPSPSGSGYDSLTLPPINPEINYDHELPSLEGSHFFDALPPPPPPSHQPSPPPRAEAFLFADTPHSRDLPLPPGQQVSRNLNRTISQYSIRESESPDPFEEFVEVTPARSPAPTTEDMPPRAKPSRAQTRASSYVDLTESSPPQSIALPPKKRKRNGDDAGEGRAPKGKRETTADKPSVMDSLENVEVVDLDTVDSKKEYEEFKAKQQAEAIRQQNEEEANKPMKLSEFQCIICMDNPTDLTVTHCGHLFCSECLHSALFAGDKKTCPVCRTAIASAKPNMKPPKNGTFHLEMKLMTANKKGKQPAKVH